jgi:methylaspartate ammonia-lyase
MKIRHVLLAPGTGGFFYDDQAAIVAGAAHDGFRYVGAPLTPGFSAIRQPAASLSIGLVLDDETIVWGDMMAVQYSGAGGRDPLFDAAKIAALVREIVVPRLLDCDPSAFLAACGKVFATAREARLPLAVEYGVSQALLRAAAHIARRTMTEVICAEFDLPVLARAIPLYAQSGDAREINVDKMILKAVDVLPHGLINARDKFGPKGETFRDYVRWVARRIGEIGAPGYAPILHFDIYGWAGLAFGLDAEAIAEFLARVGDDVPGFTLNIECPADFGSTAAQVEGYAAIIAAMARRGTTARIVADERCNTLDDIRQFAEAGAAHLVQIKMPDVGSIADTARAVLLCKRHGVGAYVGGSCAETDLSARASVHIAVATQADMMLAKPGMGVDEGISIVGNEQARLLETLRHRASHTAPVEQGL